MSSFYGNIKNDQRISIVFDRIYSSRVEMQTELTKTFDNNHAITGDGVFINRYVLINYNYNSANGEFDEFEYPVIGNGNVIERSSTFTNNLNKDKIKYNEDYHLTIWMKIFSNNEEKYILVGKLKASSPNLNIISDAPGGEPHLDLLQSSDTQYTYHVPKNWDIVLYDKTDEKDSIEYEYPYVNIKNDINDAKHRRYDNSKNYIEFQEQQKDGASLYPDHQYVKVNITANTYIPRHYYYQMSAENDNPIYILDLSESFDSNKTYFIKTSIPATNLYTEIKITSDNYEAGKYYYLENNEYKLDVSTEFNENKEYFKYSSIQLTEQNDQQALKIHLPALGNAMTEIYDALYGKQVTNDDGNGNGQRLLTAEQLFNTDGIMPYNNIDSIENISMTWAIEELKNYISELRFLGHGQGWRLLGYTRYTNLINYSKSEIPETTTTHCIIQSDDYYLTNNEIANLKPFNTTTGYTIPVYVAQQDGQNGMGLQSDWIQNNINAFGYIYHKPRKIRSKSEEDIDYTYELSTDQFFIYNTADECNDSNLIIANNENYLLYPYELNENIYETGKYYLKKSNGNYVYADCVNFNSNFKYYIYDPDTNSTHSTIETIVDTITIDTDITRQLKEELFGLPRNITERY